MSPSSTDQIPRIEFQVGRSPLTEFFGKRYRDEAPEVGSDGPRRTTVVLGAAALSLFVAALEFGPVWLVLFGPFVLITLGRTMGIRSLWR